MWNMPPAIMPMGPAAKVSTESAAFLTNVEAIEPEPRPWMFVFATCACVCATSLLSDPLTAQTCALSGWGVAKGYPAGIAGIVGEGVGGSAACAAAGTSAAASARAAAALNHIA